ncbi:MAG TPA: FAD-dependent oxidoreductase [bacterium]|nr:FAD-dependent oxidoreductase [bacterium]HNT67015.1 FAD-dependent oxidoreductase [bacterium]HOX86888.1 FAD-dependent oxidoreductase [bacterium]HPG46219.1 FAD-dependent oxidoreductase [bacterium]HPM98587.1 FAD-dependent oxidoreductase [bacterium]
MQKILAIGGSDAGISAALRAKELDPATEFTLLLSDRYPNFSICGLPFYLSGEVGDWRNLAHRTLNDIQNQGIVVLAEHVAQSIDAARKSVHIQDLNTGKSMDLNYDKLIIGTGSVSMRPSIDGVDLDGVFFLRWMADSFAFKKHLESRKPKSITIIGAGYIGMEMADAMHQLGLEVNVVEFFPSVLTTVDLPLGQLVQSELERHRIQVYTQTAVTAIERQKEKLVVRGKNGFTVDSDMVLIATGSRPETALAQTAGFELGFKGAIRVNRKMETTVSHIYAAGDCAETYHCLLGENRYLPLGTTAHKQGRIAGENALGGSREYAGSLGTQSVKIFDLVAARTGLKNDEARSEGFDPFTADFATWDHKVYYPGAKKLFFRLTGDRKTHRLLGLQIVGAYGTEVSKRIDIAAAAVYHKMQVEELNNLDLSYTPPLSSPWDPVQMAAQQWMRSL